VAAVALANKNARVLWALLARNATYRPPAILGGQAASASRLKPDKAADGCGLRPQGRAVAGLRHAPARLRAARLIPASAAPAPGTRTDLMIPRQAEVADDILRPDGCDDLTVLLAFYLIARTARGIPSVVDGSRAIFVGIPSAGAKIMEEP